MVKFIKKKNPVSNLHILLNEKLREMRQNHNKSFYYGLTALQVESAEEWCRRNNLYMEVDHKTDNILIYKFSV